MAKAKITEREVETLRNASRRSGKALYLWDTEVRGLGFCVLASGEGAWLVQKWMGGRRGKLRRVVIGHQPPMTVDEARRRCIALPRTAAKPQGGKLLASSLASFR